MANKISLGQPLRQQLLPALFPLSVRRGNEKTKKELRACRALFQICTPNGQP